MVCGWKRHWQCICVWVWVPVHDTQSNGSNNTDAKSYTVSIICVRDATLDSIVKYIDIVVSSFFSLLFLCRCYHSMFRCHGQGHMFFLLFLCYFCCCWCYCCYFVLHFLKMQTFTLSTLLAKGLFLKTTRANEQSQIDEKKNVFCTMEFVFFHTWC